MSADNWDICPKCKIKHQNDAAKAKQKAMDSYGKVTAEQWLKLQEKAKAETKLEATLSEYYELGIHECKFFVSYGASCRECGFEFTYKHEQDVKI